jgi:hypothetical protein
MAKTYTQSFSTDDRRFVFQFNYSGNDNNATIELTILFNKPNSVTPSVVPVFGPHNCSLNTEIRFDSTKTECCGTAIIKGYVTLFIHENEIWINSDFYYGLKDHSIHFEGILGILNFEIHPINPPIEPGEEPEEKESIDIYPSPEIDQSKHEFPDHEKDSFPYIYMRYWPRITTEDLEANFIIYPNVNNSKLFNMLSDKTIDRIAKEKAAINFINNSNNFIRLISDETSSTYYLPILYRQIKLMALNEKPLNVLEFLSLIIQTLRLEPNKSSEKGNETQMEDYVTLIQDFLKTAKLEKSIDNVWNSYFSLIFTLGYDDFLLKNLYQCIAVYNCLNHLFLPTFLPIEITKQAVLSLIEASIVLPSQFFSNTSTNSPPISPPSMQNNASIPYAIGELQMVKERFIRYQSGEIAHIENIMSGEKKEVQKRKLTRTSEHDENSDLHLSSELLKNKSKQTEQATEKIHHIVDNAKETDYSNLKTSYGTPNILTYDGKITVKKPEERKRDILKTGKNIVDQTVNRLRHEVKKNRNFKQLSESEDLVTSTFDNSSNNKSTMAVYRWLNKVYKNYIVNYGNRLMIEFIIKDPAEHYLSMYAQLNGVTLTKPKSLNELGIESYKDISIAKYADYYAECSDIKAAPKAKTVSATLSVGSEELIKISDNYYADSLELVASISSDSSITYLDVMVGKHYFHLTSGMSVSSKLDKETGSIPVSVFVSNDIDIKSPPETIANFGVNIEILCEPSPDIISKWQVDTYNALKASYYIKTQEYYEKSKFNFTNDAQFKNFDSQLIQQELMNQCIGELFRIYQTENPDESQESLGIGELRYLQFFKSLFEWNEMYYVFHESFQKEKKRTVPELFVAKNESLKQAFSFFINADYARIILPVVPENNGATLFYLASAYQWTADKKICPATAEYVLQPGQNNIVKTTGFDQTGKSNVEVINEIKKIDFTEDKVNQVGEAWEVVLPTTMTVLEESSKLFQTNEGSNE